MRFTSIDSSQLKLMACLIIAFFVSACATQKHPEILKQYVYSPSENRMQQIDETLLKAKSEGKLAMIVLGAQWCHDSVGLAANFSTEAMQNLLNDKYETLFVDVGYLEDRRDITQRFGYPSYFGTPTVLIIEPNTERLLNYDSISKWQSADSVPVAEYLSYFEGVSSNTAKPGPVKAKAELTKRIKQFEQQQVERLYRAYSVLGPMLQADEEGTLASKEGFYKTWKEIRVFRTQLQADLVSLRNIAKQKHQDKDKSRLLLPEYPAFEWETM